MSRRLRITLHIGYWCVVLLFFVLYFGERPDRYGQNLAFAALLLPVTVTTTYFILYRLIPGYLLRRRYFLFGLYVVYTLVVSFYLELVIVVSLYMTVSGYQQMVVSPDFPSLLDAILGMYLFVTIAVAAHLTRLHTASSLRLKEAELSLLKSQIHPHFLFNSLNGLYALALEKSDETAEHVVRLSTILDYVLYKAEKQTVPLEEELDMVRSYVELESMRCADRADIRMEVEGDPERLRVAPLLILPLVENAFKHGIHTVGTRSFAHFRVDVQSDRLDVRVSNSLSPATDEGGGGLGLRNLRQRLEFAYPGHHTLDIRPSDTRFEVHLSISLS